MTRPPAAWALHTDLDLDGVNQHLAALEDVGVLGIVEVDGRATVYLPRRTAGLPVAGVWTAVPDEDWSQTWKAGLAPVTVGALTISPPWLAGRSDVEGVEVVIEPGQAFGTGHHETTTGCLQALQERPLGASRVLDVGTGTGILAISAALLGCGEVVAVDSDPLAVEAALVNARVNGVRIDVREGSLEALPQGMFDVVVANLDTTTLRGLAAGLAAVLHPRGRLITSGISIERLDEALEALRDAGLVPEARPGDAWATVIAIRSHPAAACS